MTPEQMAGREIDHYEEYLHGVWNRDLEPEEYEALSDHAFQTYRYFPAYWGFNLVVTKDERGRLTANYEEKR